MKAKARANFSCFVRPAGAGAAEEDELFEVGVVESNCVYRLVENRLVPHERAWASTPSAALLRSTEVRVPTSAPARFCRCFLAVTVFVLPGAGVRFRRRGVPVARAGRLLREEERRAAADAAAVGRSVRLQQLWSQPTQPHPE